MVVQTLFEDSTESAAIYDMLWQLIPFVDYRLTEKFLPTGLADLPLVDLFLLCPVSTEV